MSIQLVFVPLALVAQAKHVGESESLGGEDRLAHKSVKMQDSDHSMNMLIDNLVGSFLDRMLRATSLNHTIVDQDKTMVGKAGYLPISPRLSCCCSETTMLVLVDCCACCKELVAQASKATPLRLLSASIASPWTTSRSHEVHQATAGPADCPQLAALTSHTSHWGRLRDWDIRAGNTTIVVLPVAPDVLVFRVDFTALLPYKLDWQQPRQEAITLEVTNQDSGDQKSFIRTINELMKSRGEIVVSGLAPQQYYSYSVSASSVNATTEAGEVRTAWRDSNDGCFHGLSLPISRDADPARIEAFASNVSAIVIPSRPEQPSLKVKATQVVEVDQGIWYGWDEDLKEIISNAVDNTSPLTQETLETALTYCGLESRAIELLEQNQCFSISAPELWTTHDCCIRSPVGSTNEYINHFHIDADTLGAESSKNMLPEGKRALNVWILMSANTTQPLVLVRRDGAVVYNPFQIRGSFIVWDYTSVPHMSLTHVHLIEDNATRLSVDYRFVGQDTTRLSVD